VPTETGAILHVGQSAQPQADPAMSAYGPAMRQARPTNGKLEGRARGPTSRRLLASAGATAARLSTKEAFIILATPSSLASRRFERRFEFDGRIAEYFTASGTWGGGSARLARSAHFFAAARRWCAMSYTGITATRSRRWSCSISTVCRG